MSTAILKDAVLLNPTYSPRIYKLYMGRNSAITFRCRLERKHEGRLIVAELSCGEKNKLILLRLKKGLLLFERTIFIRNWTLPCHLALTEMRIYGDEPFKMELEVHKAVPY
jgi:hypothetical protein